MYNLKVNDPFFLPHAGCNVEFVLEKGQGLVIAGENGLGKTTLLQKMWETIHVEVAPVLIEQKALDYFYDRKLSQVKYIFLKACYPEVKETWFQELWNLFGLDQKEDRLLSHLSGGENQALKLCLGLSKEADLYFLDEPSQFLDHDKKNQLKQVLIGLMARGKAILLIEHDLSWLNSSWRVEELGIKNNSIQKVKSWTT